MLSFIYKKVQMMKFNKNPVTYFLVRAKKLQFICKWFSKTSCLRPGFKNFSLILFFILAWKAIGSVIRYDPSTSFSVLPSPSLYSRILLLAELGWIHFGFFLFFSEESKVNFTNVMEVLIPVTERRTLRSDDLTIF